MLVGRSSGCENLICKTQLLVINPFVNFEPVQIFKNRRDMIGFGDFDNNTRDGILNKLGDLGRPE